MINIGVIKRTLHFELHLPKLCLIFLVQFICRVLFYLPIFAKRSTAFVKSLMVFSTSPCSIPSRTQWLICPSRITCPTLCSADLAALIWLNTSSQGMSYSIIRSIACTWPKILRNRRCRFSESIHCFILLLHRHVFIISYIILYLKFLIQLNKYN